MVQDRGRRARGPRPQAGRPGPDPGGPTETETTQGTTPGLRLVRAADDAASGRSAAEALAARPASQLSREPSKSLLAKPGSS
ncbi:MAG: hypothetical protein ACRDJO_13560, partial [Actinomycetota bacterium]